MMLKEARFKKNISQWELSKICGVSQNRISLIENEYVEAKHEEKFALASMLDLEIEKIDWPDLTGKH